MNLQPDNIRSGLAQDNTLSLQIGHLALTVSTNVAGLQLNLPDSHQKFSKPITDDGFLPSTVLPLLELTLLDQDLPINQLDKRICQVEIWELWHDLRGQFVFVQPRQIPPRCIVVDPDFQTGQIWGSFSTTTEYPFYPLQYIDIVLFSNWLAYYDDLILHAAGIAYHGKGIAFIGASGSGKSTLIANLPQHPALTILGEDQVILRYLEGEFWIFGTPWHINPDRCSPQGVPLEKIFFLNRLNQKPVSPITSFPGITQLMQTAFIPYYRPDKVNSLLDRLTLLAEQVQMHTLAFKLGTNILPEILKA